MFLALRDLDPDPSVRGTDPDPAPDSSLFLKNASKQDLKQNFSKNLIFNTKENVPVGKL